MNYMWSTWNHGNNQSVLSVGPFQKLIFIIAKDCFKSGGLEDALEAPQTVAHWGGLNSGFKDIENWLSTFENCEISSETQILTSFSKDLWPGKLVFHNMLLSIVLAALFIYSCNLFIYSVFS